MKRKAGIILVVLILLSSGSVVCAENQVHFNFGLVPGGFINAPHADGFEASKTTSLGYSTSHTKETVTGSTAFTPGGFIGLDIDPPSSGVGFDIFGHGLLSAVITGNIYGANVSYIFPHAEGSKIRVRMKGGYVGGSLDWHSDRTTVEFDDANGWQAGLGFEVGRRVRFYSEVLYRKLEFDVDKNNSDRVNRDSLDLSGEVINLGIKFSF